MVTSIVRQFIGKHTGEVRLSFFEKLRKAMMNYKKPERIFEDSGTVDPKMSYHIELENAVNTKNQDIKTMVDLGRYFSIFAPRQSGKTTFFQFQRFVNAFNYLSGNL